MAVFELMEAEGKIAALRAENERLRAALFAVANHELRDHEDYEAIQEIATIALKQE